MKAELLHEKRVISSQHDEPNHKKTSEAELITSFYLIKKVSQ